MPVNDIHGVPLVDPKVLTHLADGPLPVATNEKSHNSNSRPEPNAIIGSVYGKTITAADVGLTEPIDVNIHFNAGDKPRWIS